MEPVLILHMITKADLDIGACVIPMYIFVFLGDDGMECSVYMAVVKRIFI